MTARSAAPHPRALRRHFARHNAQALGLAAASLVGAGLLWGLLVLATYWFTLLGATIARGTDPERSMQIFDARDLLGPMFWPTLIAGSAGLIVLTLAVRRWRWGDWLRESRFYLVWAFLEILLLPPTLLLAAWGNLRALVWLRPGDRRLAWALLQTVGTHERAGEPLPLTGLPAELGSAGRARSGLNRALFALQLTDLVTLRERTGEGWLLTLASEEARTLCGWPTPETVVEEP